jgi:hypothetical protein
MGGTVLERSWGRDWQPDRTANRAGNRTAKEYLMVILAVALFRRIIFVIYFQQVPGIFVRWDEQSIEQIFPARQWSWLICGARLCEPQQGSNFKALQLYFNGSDWRHGWGHKPALQFFITVGKPQSVG